MPPSCSAPTLAEMAECMVALAARTVRRREPDDRDQPIRRPLRLDAPSFLVCRRCSGVRPWSLRWRRSPSWLPLDCRSASAGAASNGQIAVVATDSTGRSQRHHPDTERPPRDQRGLEGAREPPRYVALQWTPDGKTLCTTRPPASGPISTRSIRQPERRLLAVICPTAATGHCRPMGTRSPTGAGAAVRWLSTWSGRMLNPRRKLTGGSPPGLGWQPPRAPATPTGDSRRSGRTAPGRSRWDSSAERGRHHVGMGARRRELSRRDAGLRQQHDRRRNDLQRHGSACAVQDWGHPRAADLAATWSPGGTRLAFTEAFGFDQKAGDHQSALVATADGSDPHRIDSAHRDSSSSSPGRRTSAHCDGRREPRSDRSRRRNPREGDRVCRGRRRAGPPRMAANALTGPPRSASHDFTHSSWSVRTPSGRPRRENIARTNAPPETRATCPSARAKRPILRPADASDTPRLRSRAL